MFPLTFPRLDILLSKGIRESSSEAEKVTDSSHKIQLPVTPKEAAAHFAAHHDFPVPVPDGDRGFIIVHRFLHRWDTSHSHPDSEGKKRGWTPISLTP